MGPGDATVLACLAALQGTLPPGAECSFVYECAAGLCLPGLSCPASCPSVLGEGAACSVGGPACDVRLGLLCRGGRCERPSQLGESCDLGIDCASELICGSSHVCGRLRRAGEACAADENCQQGLYCFGDELGATCVLQHSVGMPCSEDVDHADAALRGAECQDGLVCAGAGLTLRGSALAGHCARPVAEGAACLIDPGGTQVFEEGCALGLYCPARACVPLPVSGPCTPHDACDATSFCSGDGTCQTVRADGSRCAAAIECESGTCAAGACARAELLCHES